jgi:aminoglycoside 6-adenylyltransferase
VADRVSSAWLPRLRQWVEEEPNIRLALLVGSQARARTPADRFSDIDLAVFVREPTVLLQERGWIARLGPHWTAHREATPIGGACERRVLFRDGQDLDLAVFPSDDLPNLMADATALAVLGRGFRVLVDKDSRMGTVPAGPPAPALPSEEEFANLVNDFWFHLVWAAKKNRRGEWMAASEAVNGHLRGLSIRLARWQALVRHPAGPDVWHGSRYFEKWADPRVLRELPETVAGYDAVSIARALRALQAMIGWLSDELRQSLSFPDPVQDRMGLSHYLDELVTTAEP